MTPLTITERYNDQDHVITGPEVFQETSAKEDTGIRELFDEVGKKIDEVKMATRASITLTRRGHAEADAADKKKKDCPCTIF